MGQVTIYTTEWCGYCRAAKQLLEQRGIGFEEVRVDSDPAFRRRLLELTGGWTVPQVVIDGEPIGGYRELARLASNGGLEHPHAAGGC